MGVAVHVLLVVSIALGSRSASADPSDRTLQLTAIGLMPPTFVATVSLHEGSHALAAMLVGGEVDEIHIFPPGTDPRSGTFRAGWTHFHGVAARGDHVFVDIAPKLTESALLGAFTALVFTDAWPRNRYAQLALTEGAYFVWFDFAPDVFAYSPHNDFVKVLHGWCMHGWQQLPARVLYAGIAVGFGWAVVRGYERTSTTSTVTPSPRLSLVAPLASGHF